MKYNEIRVTKEVQMSYRCYFARVTLLQIKAVVGNALSFVFSFAKFPSNRCNISRLI